MKRIVSAVFDNRTQAEAAVNELRAAGVDNNALSVIAQHDGKTTMADDTGGHAETTDGSSTAKGAIAGGGLGMLLGIAALAIPGVGPLAAAGAIAASAVPGAAAIGAVAGATAGGVAGALKEHGVDDNDATYYEDRINAGATFVSVDTTMTTAMDYDTIWAIFQRHGGHNATTGARTTAGMTA